MSFYAVLVTVICQGCRHRFYRWPGFRRTNCPKCGAMNKAVA